MIGFRQRHRRVLVVAATVVVLAPFASRATAATPPPAQDTSAFCANASTSTSFTDLDQNSAHYHNILCAVSAGIAKGKTSTTYAPAAIVTRGQMATFVARALDEANALVAQGVQLNPLPPYDGVNRFADVSPTDTHVASINRLAKAGIVSGKSPGIFDPGGDVTRGQMATFLNNAEGFLTGSKYDSSQDFFTDDDANIHEPNINAIASVGIANGVGGTSYAPDQGVARDQMASFLIRWLAVEHAAGNIEQVPAPEVTAQSTTVDDADNSGALSKNDVITITFVHAVAVSSSITVTDSGSSAATLTDASPVPSGQTAATFVLDSSKKVLKITPTAAVIAAGGDNVVNGTATITAASGITPDPSGPEWDPATDPQSQVQFTFAPPVAQSGVVTFVSTSTDTYRFVANGANSETTVKYTSADAYVDDGAAATMAKFEADLTVGDLIKYTPNTPAAGQNRHELTNKSPSNYTSGMVGNIDETSTVHHLYIIEPVSGAALSDAKDYATNATWTVDGASATQQVFEGALSEGDTIDITPGSGGAATSFALTNRSVSGAVSTFDTGNKLVMIRKLGDDPTSSQDASYNYGLAGSTWTVDGSPTSADDFGAKLSKGDQLTYIRNGGNQSFTLTNTVPAAISGMVTETRNSNANTVIVVNGADRSTIDYSTATQFRVDGVLSTEGQLEAKMTAGDSVTFQPADAPTNTVGTMSLTNAVPDPSATGHMRDIHGNGTTYDIVNDQGGIIFDNLNYVFPQQPDFGGTAASEKYFVKKPGETTETSLSEPQWESYLNGIGSSNVADIFVVGKPGVIEHHLTTDATPAGP